MDNKLVKSILVGVVTFAGVLLVGSLLRTLIRGETYKDALMRPYMWYVSGVGGIGTGLAFFKRGEKK